MPIRVSGSLVGVLAVSGLTSADDHSLALTALRAAAADQPRSVSRSGRPDDDQATT
ncbi:heme-binding protein [Kribbella caucasensis]|uniref:heme-binding protein n=1 Tax=Kribbella caucasensis TaxID=2512215 RepID=UPI0010600CF9